MKTIFLLPFLLGACSTVIIHPDGKVAVRGDIKNFAYQRNADGSATVMVADANISSVVTAFGKAVTPAFMAMATVAALNASNEIIHAVRQPVH